MSTPEEQHRLSQAQSTELQALVCPCTNYPLHYSRDSTAFTGFLALHCLRDTARCSGSQLPCCTATSRYCSFLLPFSAAQEGSSKENRNGGATIKMQYILYLLCHAFGDPVTKSEVATAHWSALSRLQLQWGNYLSTGEQGPFGGACGQTLVPTHPAGLTRGVPSCSTALVSAVQRQTPSKSQTKRAGHEVATGHRVPGAGRCWQLPSASPALHRAQGTRHSQPRLQHNPCAGRETPEAPRGSR